MKQSTGSEVWKASAGPFAVVDYVCHCSPSLPEQMIVSRLHPRQFPFYLSSKLISILLESVQFADFSEKTIIFLLGCVLDSSPESLLSPQRDSEH